MSNTPKLDRWVEKLRSRGFEVEVRRTKNVAEAQVVSGEWKFYSVGNSFTAHGVENFCPNRSFSRRKP